MRESNARNKLVEVLEVLSKLNSKDMRELKDYLANSYDFNVNQTTLRQQSKKRGFLSLADKNKIDIIGGLPFLINSSRYFKSNDSIREFSEKFLHIPVPRGNKSRAELIGIIVVGIAELPPYETERIRNALNEVLEKVKTGDTRDIFFEWEQALKNINFNR
jgi:hypothetical protein